MKCDDDTFVRVDSVITEVKKVPSVKSLYIGNINYHHKPLREGKWAVTYEVTNMFEVQLRCHKLFIVVSCMIRKICLNAFFCVR